MENEDKELEQRFSKYYEDLDTHLRKFVIEFYARQLNNYYRYNLLVEKGSLGQYTSSIGNVLNVSYDFFDVRNEVEQILRNKYGLIIKNDIPLEIEVMKND